MFKLFQSNGAGHGGGKEGICLNFIKFYRCMHTHAFLISHRVSEHICALGSTMYF